MRYEKKVHLENGKNISQKKETLMVDAQILQ